MGRLVPKAQKKDGWNKSADGRDSTHDGAPLCSIFSLMTSALPYLTERVPVHKATYTHIIENQKFIIINDESCTKSSAFLHVCTEALVDLETDVDRSAAAPYANVITQFHLGATLLRLPYL
jgi:hypothetical protein